MQHLSGKFSSVASNRISVGRPAVPIQWGRRASGAVLACLLIVQPARAQVGPELAPPLDLEQAGRAAVSWHPSVVEAAARLEAQEQRIGEVRAGLYPQVSGGIGSGYDSTLRGGWRPSANLSVTQRLWDFGKLANELDSERAGIRVASAQVLISVDAIIRDTSYSYIEILRGRALLEAARDQLDRVRDVSELVNARFQRGATTRSDALQTVSRVDAAQSTIQQIEAAWLRWQTNLSYLLGQDDFPVIAAGLPSQLQSACTMPGPDWTEVPALREAQARVERADSQVRQQHSERLPTISLGASGRSDLLDPLGDDRVRYDFGLRVDSSIFNGGAARSRIRGAESARAAAQAALAATRLEATRQLAEARSQVETLQARGDTLQSRFAVMEQTRELYRLQYLELGTRTLVDLLNADQELSQIRFDEINTRFDLARLGVDCLHASGRLREALNLGDMVIEGVPL